MRWIWPSLVLLFASCQSAEPWQDQQTPTTTDVRRISISTSPFSVVVFVVVVDQSGDIGDASTETEATQKTSVDAKADVRGTP